MERRKSRLIGFVPTMGYLHEGHLSLIRKARSENDFVAVSIFVNPKQFGPEEDLDRYPRNLEGDIRMLIRENVDLLFSPTSQEMYPESPGTRVVVPKVGERLCGVSRPDHFRGVATVVAKLFNIIQADRSYFGQKDYQQTVVIRKMVRDLNIPTEIIVCPTVREPDGLAMSSRNSYLDAKGREAAGWLIQALRKAEQAISAGEAEPATVASIVRGTLEARPEIRVEYVEVLDAENLNNITKITDRKVILVALAARIDNVRLIDNLVVHVP